MLDANEFLVTALWSTLGFDDEMLDAKYSVDDVPQDFVDKCQALCDEFMQKASYLFTQDEIDTSHIEHDLWLTMHGHGAGFWDGDYENGDQLSEIAKEMGTLEDELRDILP